MAPTAGLENKTSSKRKVPDDTEKDKGIRIEEKQSEAAKPHEKKLRIDRSTEEDENVDVLATPTIHLTGTYPPKAKEPQESKDHPETAPIDPDLAEIEARTEHSQTYFSASCDPGEHLKQTPAEEVVAKRFWEHYERTGEFLTAPAPDNPVISLMDVIDDNEKLYYINDDAPMETQGKNLLVSMHDEVGTILPKEKGQGVGSKARDPIELGSSVVENPEENLSWSPPPTFDEAELNAEELIEGGNALGSKGDDTLLLETTGTSPSNSLLPSLVKIPICEDLSFSWFFSSDHFGCDGYQR